MSKKKQKAPKGNVVWKQTAEEATLAKKPRYNGFACGYGAHGDAKYNRTKAKRVLQQQLRQEGASRGSFLLYMRPFDFDDELRVEERGDEGHCHDADGNEQRMREAGRIGTGLGGAMGHQRADIRRHDTHKERRANGARNLHER